MLISKDIPASFVISVPGHPSQVPVSCLSCLIPSPSLDPIISQLSTAPRPKSIRQNPDAALRVVMLAPNPRSVIPSWIYRLINHRGASRIEIALQSSTGGSGDRRGRQAAGAGMNAPDAIHKKHHANQQGNSARQSASQQIEISTPLVARLGKQNHHEK